VISINVSSIITSMTQHSRLIGKIIHLYPANSAKLGRIVFKDEKNLIFVGMYTRRGNRLHPVKSQENYAGDYKHEFYTHCPAGELEFSL